jgi:hypothetical protein
MSGLLLLKPEPKRSLRAAVTGCHGKSLLLPWYDALRQAGGGKRSGSGNSPYRRCRLAGNISRRFAFPRSITRAKIVLNHAEIVFGALSVRIANWDPNLSGFDANKSLNSAQSGN